VAFASIIRPLIYVAFAACLFACNRANAPVQPKSDLDALANTVAAAAGYSASAVELTGSAVRLRININDAALSAVDQATRERVANDVVAAVEAQLTTHPDLHGVQAISVAIGHPADAGKAPTKGWHIEDVVEFRKTQNLHFVIHTT
jgi:hypothetical protein